MVDPTIPQNAISAQDALRTEIIINQALIDVLLAKQVITEAELLHSIQNIRRDQQKMINESKKIISLKT